MLISVGRALRQGVLTMALDALMGSSVALVKIPIFCHAVGAPMGHVVVVADALLLLVPPTVTVETFGQISSSLSRLLATAAFALTRVRLCWSGFDWLIF